jgi:transcriptional regulator with XRE-family HTH domain
MSYSRAMVQENPVRAFRLSLGMTQREFGKAIGATQAAVSNYELSKRLPWKAVRRMLDLAQRNGYELDVENFVPHEHAP